MGVIEVIDKISAYISKTSHKLALEIGARNLKIVLIESDAMRAKFIAFRIIEMPTLAPDQKNKFAVEEALKFIDENDVDIADIYISQTENIFLKRITLPDMPYKEILSAVKWNIREEVPFGINNSLVGYEHIGTATAADGSKTIEVVSVAAKRDDIYDCINLFVANNLRVVNVTTPASNILNMVRHAKNIDQSKNSTILDIGFKKSIIAIVKDKKLVYIRIIPFGSNDITESLTQAVSEGDKVVSLSYEEAEKLKLKEGIPVSSKEKSKSKDIDVEKVNALIRPVIEGLSNDITRSLNFYKSRYDPEFKLEELYLFGGGSKTKNIDVFLKEALSAEIKYCEPSVFDMIIHDSEGIQCERENSQLCQLIAMLVSSTKSGNLLPAQFKAYKYELLEHLVIKIAVLAAVAYMILSCFSVNFRLDAYRKKLDTVKIHWQGIKTVKDYDGRIGMLNTLIHKIQSPSTSEISLLKVLSNFTPPNVVIDRIQYDKKSESLKISGTMLIGRDRAANALADFVSDLESTPLLSEVNLAWSKQRGTDDNPTVDFEIKGKVVYRK